MDEEKMTSRREEEGTERGELIEHQDQRASKSTSMARKSCSRGHEISNLVKVEVVSTVAGKSCNVREVPVLHTSGSCTLFSDCIVFPDARLLE